MNSHMKEHHGSYLTGQCVTGTSEFHGHFNQRRKSCSSDIFRLSTVYVRNGADALLESRRLCRMQFSSEGGNSDRQCEILASSIRYMAGTQLRPGVHQSSRDCDISHMDNIRSTKHSDQLPQQPMNQIHCWQAVIGTLQFGVESAVEYCHKWSLLVGAATGGCTHLNNAETALGIHRSGLASLVRNLHSTALLRANVSYCSFCMTCRQ